MKTLPQYINEYLIKKKVDKVRNNYEYTPQTNKELQTIVKQLIKEGKTDLNCIDVSKITDFSWIFNAINVDFDVSGWDVSNATNMYSMFFKCENFTGKGLENWDVSNVTTMHCMFNLCRKFDCDLSRWDVSKVENTNSMFVGCSIFTGKGLEHWDVSNVTNMSYMFYNCKNFDCDISAWDVSSLCEAAYTFKDCTKFDCDLENWNVNKLFNKEQMFNNCSSLKNKPSWYK